MHLDGAELTTVLCVGHQGVGQPASTLPQSSDGEARCDCSGREARNSVLGSYRDSKSGRCLWDTSTRKREKWFSSSPVLSAELLTKGSKEEQRDYVFYLAVGNYRLKEYEKALKYVRGLLQTEPQNNQAKELERLIDKAMKKDGLVGMAIVGGMALGVAGVAGLIGLAVSKFKSS